MKAEHRKELETNTLVRNFNSALQHAKEGPSQKTILVGGLILLVVVLVCVFVYFSRSTKESDSVRWEKWFEDTQLSNATLNPEQAQKLEDEYPGLDRATRERLDDLRKFVEVNKGTTQARLARFQQARLLLQASVNLGAQLANNRNDARKCIKKANELYEKLIDESGNVPYLAQEALYNAAQTNEDLGEFDKAKKQYTRLRKDYPKSLYAPQAEKALTRLNDEKELETLKKIAAAN